MTAIVERARERRQYGLKPLRTASWAALALFTLIVITGSGVRLTGSGLGCSNWPNCSDQSLAPQDGHAYIEFGNRLITTPVAIASIACLVLALLQAPRRRDLVRLGVWLNGLVVAQIVLGAIAVWTHLNWAAVSGHYVLSLASLYVCVSLVRRVEHDIRGIVPAPRTDEQAAGLTRALAIFAAIVVVLGTFVTASGPHAGGAGTGDVVGRLSVFGGDTFPTMVMIHARIAAVFGVAAVAVWFLARRRGARELLAPLTAICVLVAVAGLIGRLQYHVFDYPAELVWAHVMVATLLWNAAVWAWLAAGRRSADNVGLREERGV